MRRLLQRKVQVGGIAVGLLLCLLAAISAVAQVAAGPAEVVQGYATGGARCAFRNGGADEHIFAYSAGGANFTIITDGHVTMRVAGAPGVAPQNAECVAGLEPGSARSPSESGWFDSRGVWLGAAFEARDHTLYGFYHAESPISNECAPGEQHPYRCRSCNGILIQAGRCVIDPVACAVGHCAINGLAPHQSIALAVSHDGGRSWVKPNYPHNEAITGPPDYGQAGNVSMVAFENFLYAFYFGDAPYVARAPLASLGRPDAWRKYFCASGEKNPGSCGFTEPGLYGRATRLRGLSRGAFVVYNRYLNKLIEIDNAIQSGTIALKSSADGLRWSLIDAQPASLRPMQDGWADIYPSLIGPEGEGDALGQRFFLYEVRQKLPLRQQRLLMRVPIELK